jgi:hypothetical protein
MTREFRVGDRVEIDPLFYEAIKDEYKPLYKPGTQGQIIGIDKEIEIVYRVQFFEGPINLPYPLLHYFEGELKLAIPDMVN